MSAGHHSMMQGASAPPAPAYWGLCFTAEEPNVVVNMSKTGSPPAVTLETSTDGETWTTFDAENGTTPITLAAVGDRVFFRAGAGGNTRMGRLNYATHYHSFTLSGRCAASGLLSSLLDADDPAKALTSYCFTRLFVDCATLTSAPEITLSKDAGAGNCCTYMFSGCSSLVRGPSRLYVGNGCSNMFAGCSSLRFAPRISCGTIGSGSNVYASMFSGCSSLSLIEIDYCPPAGQMMMTNMLTGLGPHGVLRTFDVSAEAILQAGLPQGWTLETVSHPFAVATNWSMTITFKEQTRVSQDLGETWATFEPQETLTLSTRRVAFMESTREALPTATVSVPTIPGSSKYVMAGDLSSLAIRGGNAAALPDRCFYQAFYNQPGVSSSNMLYAKYLRINVTSPRGHWAMFSYRSDLRTGPVPTVRTMYDYCFYNMFHKCVALADASGAFSDAAAAPHCCELMYQDCTALTAAPTLPATTMADTCYYGMFYGCTSLTVAPELPATMMASSCYQRMFYGCTSLTVAPELPATALENICYREMFHGCTSLTVAPELPATTLATGCYDQMFSGCIALTVAPELPATTLAVSCYGNMFEGCTSLTAAPELPATTLAESCYVGMLFGCTSLTAAPELPATTLAVGCYGGMFYGCTSLTVAPELPATALEKGCYESMFGGCASLAELAVGFLDWGVSLARPLSKWVLDVAASGTFRCPTALGTDATIERGADRCPVGWTVVNTD